MVISKSFPIKGLSGQTIINAVKKVAEQPHTTEDYVGRDKVVILGQKSMDPSAGFVVLVDGDAEVHPNRIYDEIMVQSHVWLGGLYNGVISTEESIEKNLDIFLEKLKVELTPKT